MDGSSALQAANVDLPLAVTLLVGAPRLRIPLCRLLLSAVLIVVGLALPKAAGRWYVARMTSNPAGQVAAGAIGLLTSMCLLPSLPPPLAVTLRRERHQSPTKPARW